MYPPKESRLGWNLQEKISPFVKPTENLKAYYINLLKRNEGGPKKDVVFTVMRKNKTDTRYQENQSEPEHKRVKGHF